MSNNQPMLFDVERKFVEVWNCGGGRQSAAILALIIQGKLPKPDICAIADTGRENSSTWEYLNGTLQPAAKAFGLEIVRIPKSIYATVDLWGGKELETLLIPAFTTANGKVGKLSNFCSNEWKTRVVQRWLSKKGVTTARNWLGFSIDEPKRWIPRKDDEWTRLPLVEQGITKEGCFKAVAEMGWKLPSHSSCWMCPNKSDSEWIDLKTNYPQDFESAAQLQREIQAIDPHAWLHGSCKPLEDVAFNPADNKGRPCDSGNCFV